VNGEGAGTGAAADRSTVGGAGGVPISLAAWHSPGMSPVPPPVLLHHGLASSAGFWGPVASRLAGGTPGGPPRTVVALDARGHGESGRPDDGYDFATVTADLAAVLGALGWGGEGEPRPVLVGHSWGGNVIVEYAARHPAVPAALVLVDGGFIEMQPDVTWEEAERRLAPPDRPPIAWAEFVEIARTRSPEVGWGAEVQAAVRHNFEELPDGRMRVRLSRARHMSILRALYEQRPSRLLPLVRCPVLILPARRPTDDPEERELMERRVALVTRAEAILRRAGTPVAVAWFENTVHDVPIQRPGELAERIQRFIEGLPAGPRAGVDGDP
jgi:pimeloyl-ACP methyl ester carboxylesterase